MSTFPPDSLQEAFSYLKIKDIVRKYDPDHVLDLDHLPNFPELLHIKLAKAIKIRNYFESQPTELDPAVAQKWIAKYRDYIKDIIKQLAKSQGYQLRKTGDHEYKFKPIRPVVINVTSESSDLTDSERRPEEFSEDVKPYSKHRLSQPKSSKKRIRSKHHWEPERRRHTYNSSEDDDHHHQWHSHRSSHRHSRRSPSPLSPLSPPSPPSPPSSSSDEHDRRSQRRRNRSSSRSSGSSNSSGSTHRYVQKNGIPSRRRHHSYDDDKYSYKNHTSYGRDHNTNKRSHAHNSSSYRKKIVDQSHKRHEHEKPKPYYTKSSSRYRSHSHSRSPTPLAIRPSSPDGLENAKRRPDGLENAKRRPDESNNSERRPDQLSVRNQNNPEDLPSTSQPLPSTLTMEFNSNASKDVPLSSVPNLSPPPSLPPASESAPLVPAATFAIDRDSKQGGDDVPRPLIHMGQPPTLVGPEIDEMKKEEVKQIEEETYMHYPSPTHEDEELDRYPRHEKSYDSDEYTYESDEYSSGRSSRDHDPSGRRSEDSDPSGRRSRDHESSGSHTPDRRRSGHPSFF